MSVFYECDIHDPPSGGESSRKEPRTSTMTSKKRMRAPSACNKNAAGLFRSEESCEASCSPEQLAAADSVIASVKEWLNNIQPENFEDGMWTFKLADDLVQKTWNITEDEDEIGIRFVLPYIEDLEEGVEEKIIFHLHLTDGYPHVLLDNFFPPKITRPGEWTADDYMNFIKLIASGAALHNEKPSYVIVGIPSDASNFPKTGISYYPWLMLARGFTWYEGRGFHNHGIPDHPIRADLVDRLRSLTVKEVDPSPPAGRRPPQVGPDTTLSTFAKLYLFGTLDQQDYYVIHLANRIIEEVNDTMNKCGETNLCEGAHLRFQRKMSVDVRLSVVGIFEYFEASKVVKLKRDGDDATVIYSIVFSPDGKHIASSHGDGTLRLWNIEGGNPDDYVEFAFRVETNSFGRIDTGSANSVSFDSTGTKLVSAHDDHTIRVWDVGSVKEEQKITGHSEDVSSASFSPDNLSIVSSSYDTTVRVWKKSNSSNMFVEERKMNANYNVDYASFHPDGSKVVSATWGGVLHIWDVATGAMLNRFYGYEPITDGRFYKRIHTVFFSPDGTSVLSCAMRTVRSYNAITGDLQNNVMVGHSKDVRSALYSHDGSRVVSASLDETARIWDAKTGMSLTTLPLGGECVFASFSPDGKQIACVVDSDGDHSDHTILLCGYYD